MKKRQIKFRGWDKELNRMVSYPHLLFPNTVDINEQLRCTDYILMQYVGLSDKKGIEIYEGDIVELSINEEKPSHVGVVEYVAPKFFVMDGEKSGLLLTEKYNVIGNIYQNPELFTNHG